MDIFPFTVLDCPWLAPAALLLDLIFADPRLPWPHPVCLIGRLINCMETRARKFITGAPTMTELTRRGRLAGMVCLSAVCVAIYLICSILLHAPWAHTFFALYLAWAGLAMGCLLQTGKLALSRVENGNITEAREACGWLVSRQVDEMDRQTLRKTLADTLSENFTDAFVAPFFWLLLTGPIGLWLYKTVSTMDSQWGYLTPKWRDLGFAGAKMDDILAWVPARLSPLLLSLTYRILKIFPGISLQDGQWPGFKRISTQAKGMPSPNSGWSMASCAWLCNGRMAGPSVYFGELVPKQWLGPPQLFAGQWNGQRLLALLRLMFYGSIFGGILLWLAALVTGLFIF